MMRFASFLLLALPAASAWATFSIVACDPDGTCGAAVATHNLAVGATVIHARANTGALATQFETNPGYGPRGLERLAEGQDPADVLEELIRTDGDFDGTSVAYRQVGIVNVRGEAAVFTGDEALRAPWAGSRKGQGYAIQGNGLASERVSKAMEAAYIATSGPLATRLLAAVVAGHDQGGQAIGAMSAALLVRTPEGGWQDIDLRVDGSDAPIRDLQGLFDQHQAHQEMLRAERHARKGDRDAARLSLSRALHLGHRWDRIWRRATRLSISLGDPHAAVEHFSVFAAMNPAWARMELTDPMYSGIRDKLSFVNPAHN